MTKKEAVEKTIEIWKLLAENPLWGKESNQIFPITQNYVHSCPCCQYVAEKKYPDGFKSDFIRMNPSMC